MYLLLYLKPKVSACKPSPFQLICELKIVPLCWKCRKNICLAPVAVQLGKMKTRQLLIILPSLSLHLSHSYAGSGFFSFSRIAHCSLFFIFAPREDTSEGPRVLFRGGVMWSFHRSVPGHRCAITRSCAALHVSLTCCSCSLVPKHPHRLINGELDLVVLDRGY